MSAAGRGKSAVKKNVATLTLFDGVDSVAWSLGTSALPNLVGKTNSLSAEQRLALLQEIKDTAMNAEQREALQHVHGPILVLAGAGTGKTRVATNRIAYLVANGGRQRKILAVTFTNKARDEMAERCDQILSKYSWTRPTILTLHGLGARILRKHAHVVQYPNQVRLVSDVYQDIFLRRGLAQLDPHFVHGLGRDPHEKLKAQIGLWKNKLIGPREIAESGEALAPAYIEYQKWLHRAGLVDCDDLLRLPVAIFKHPVFGAEILRAWQRKFDFILVDEYQDTNWAQFELLRFLAQEHRNLCVVGDDDQSIYGWRAADVELIRQFPTEWPDSKVVKLVTNYRSTQPILDLGNQLMLHETGRHQKQLIASKIGRRKPEIVSHEDEFAEARWIAEKIGSSKKPFGSFAILVRSQFKLKPIKSALEEAKIPYVEWRRDRFRLGEVKRNVYALLAAIHNPEQEEPALVQLLEASRFAIDDNDYETLMILRDEGDSSLWKLLRSEHVNHLSDGSKEKLTAFTRLVHELHTESIRRPRLTKLNALAFLGMQALYPEDTSDKEWESDSPKSEITQDLKRLHAFIASYEKRTRNATLKGYLGHVERIKRRAHEPVTFNEDDKAAAVIISTIHGAKGLEFENVFMPSLNEGILPSSQSLNSNSDAQLAEERRLFYVALTRAKDGLFLSWPRSGRFRGKLRAQQVSRYLIECGGYATATVLEGGSDLGIQRDLFFDEGR